jgi:hypothetical protein
MFIKLVANIFSLRRINGASISLFGWSRLLGHELRSAAKSNVFDPTATPSQATNSAAGRPSCRNLTGDDTATPDQLRRYLRTKESVTAASLPQVRRKPAAVQNRDSVSPIKASMKETKTPHWERVPCFLSGTPRSVPEHISLLFLFRQTRVTNSQLRETQNP